MPDPYVTRAPRAEDIPTLAAIADATLFPGEMLADMIAPALAGQGDDLWRVVTRDDTPVGFAFVQPEAMTDRTWNLRAIATDPDFHGGGAGTALLAAVEAALAGARLLVIDTTQLPDQARARRFYAARGCGHVATIPDFFGPGEDKVTFVKALT
ncbi:GNAT family N-acetyltransferase [uncultured Tateyamaria sp.]|uniref:GNAT family N-acetyltransferase n=1 Tax=uncultured Tateyamaria sp. TaxID=455651 RepID=UPI0026373070|nr:GNAT family N-acetyltransferase [uncultured Tateyamaria sp.]